MIEIFTAELPLSMDTDRSVGTAGGDSTHMRNKTCYPVILLIDTIGISMICANYGKFA